MGDQQGTLDIADAAWFAGIMDGEGSICMNVRRKQWKGWKGIGVDLSLMVSNTDAGIIEKAVRIVESLVGAPPYVYEGKTKELYRSDGSAYKNERVSLLQMNVGKMVHIKTILGAIEPYLAGQKAARARLMLKFIERRMGRTGKHTTNGASWYDGYDWAVVKDFYALSGGKLLPEVQGLLNEHEQNRPFLAG